MKFFVPALLLLLLLLLLNPARAQDRGGTGTGPLQVAALRQDLNFSIEIKPGTKMLKWKIEKKGPRGAESIWSGDSLLPREHYAWFWDARSETLWFATPKNIMDIKLKDWGFTGALYRPSDAFLSYPDLPAGLKTFLPQLLKQK